MCDPITLAGIALSAGSLVANQVAASKIQSARNDVLAAERIRQQGYDREAQALNAQSQDRFTDFDAKQGEQAGELGEYFAAQKIGQADANSQAALEQATVPTSSNLTVREEQKQRGQAREFTDQQAAALGNLRSFGDLLGSISRDQARDAGQIGIVGGFKRGSSGVVPFELEQANQAGAGAKLFGDILGLGGSVALGAGLGGGAAPVDPWGGGWRTVGASVNKPSLLSLYS